MADQELGLRLKTDSDVPQAMGKAQAAVVSFDKQVQDIQKKFSTAFKDFAFAFLAPMVIFNNLLSAIQDDIAKAKADAKEGYDLIAKGDTAFASSQQKRQASYVQYRIAQQEEEQKVKAGAQKIYEEFLNTADAKPIYEKFLPQFSGPEGEATAFTIPAMASNRSVQVAIEEWFRNSKEFKDFQTPGQKQEAEKAKASQDAKDLAELKQFATRNKPGEVGGFGNVIGVGANVAMEMAQMQIDELRRHTELLQMIATKEQQPTDFSKGDKPVAAPSRAKLLSGK